MVQAVELPGFEGVTYLPLFPHWNMWSMNTSKWMFYPCWACVRHR